MSNTVHFVSVVLLLPHCLLCSWKNGQKRLRTVCADGREGENLTHIAKLYQTSSSGPLAWWPRFGPLLVNSDHSWLICGQEQTTQVPSFNVVCGPDKCSWCEPDLAHNIFSIGKPCSSLCKCHWKRNLQSHTQECWHAQARTFAYKTKYVCVFRLHSEMFPMSRAC